MIDMSAEPDIQQKIIKVLFIEYIFTDKDMLMHKLGKQISKFVMINSNGRARINYTTEKFVTNVSCDDASDKLIRSNCRDWIEQYEKDSEESFDVYIHLCNPGTSTTNNKHCYTHNIFPNVIHELFHSDAFNMGHSCTLRKNNFIQSSADCYCIMNKNIPYVSLNPVKLQQLKWLDTRSDGRMVLGSQGQTYEICELRTSYLNTRKLYVINYKGTWISVGRGCLVIHTTINDEKPFIRQTSLLIMNTQLVQGSEYCIKYEKNKIDFKLSVIKWEPNLTDKVSILID